MGSLFVCPCSRRSDSDPIGGMNYHGMRNMNGRVKSYPPAQDDSGVESANDLKTMTVPSIQIPQMGQDVTNSAPPSPGGKGSQVRLNNLLGIPQSGSVGNLSPKPLRRSLSARGPQEFTPGSASPRIRKRPPSLIVGPEFYADSISAINVPVGNSESHKPVSEVLDWAAHPSECPTKEQISLEDGGVITSGSRIYADGSKIENGVGAAFSVWSEQNIVYRWSAKLQDYNRVFQAELLALKHATDHATSLPHQLITILVDNQASFQAAANPRSRNTTAREICKNLITNKHIHISWIKAHVGYDGNEEEDRLAKEAAKSDRDPPSVKAPISFLKSIFKKKKMMEDWQSDWEDEDTGRSTFNILPRVSTQPCYWKREEILSFAGHGPFPSYLKRFNLASTVNCPCGNTNGTPFHYATEYILTVSFHVIKQAQQHELI
ncbi:hypothetical protein AVEN_241982-1 [Araneus ventricosus]|uniref:RNase H type-1 domain-containing protein n=1 Tax=Araneus ventricosus TaxID=182803 RepID=A0A4Y2E997_ARAVE|nr:hypothetical protein AVEN_241982-1 [Araneus ventricosus]